MRSRSTLLQLDAVRSAVRTLPIMVSLVAPEKRTGPEPLPEPPPPQPRVQRQPRAEPAPVLTTETPTPLAPPPFTRPTFNADYLNNPGRAGLVKIGFVTDPAPQ